MSLTKVQAATRTWWQNSREREHSWVQRSTGRRQVRFSIMGLRCAEKCHCLRLSSRV